MNNITFGMVQDVFELPEDTIYHLQEIFEIYEKIRPGITIADFENLTIKEIEREMYKIKQYAINCIFQNFNDLSKNNSDTEESSISTQLNEMMFLLCDNFSSLNPIVIRSMPFVEVIKAERFCIKHGRKKNEPIRKRAVNWW